VGLGLEGSQPGCTLDRNLSSDLVPSNKVVFVISHVKGSKHGVHKGMELAVRGVNMVVLELSDLLQVIEVNRIVVDTNVTNEILHFSVSCFVKVCKDTVFHLRVVLKALIGTDFRIHTVTEDVLIAEEVFDLLLVDGHLFGIHIVHSLLLVTVSILDSVVL
jgi:hypothetical protein